MEIPLKSKNQIKIMAEAGQRLSSIFQDLVLMVKPGLNLLEIEKKACQLIKKAGGEPAFMRVPNYHWATCLNVNEEIVHGIPKNYILKPSDVLNIDIGLYYKGFNTDMSGTLRVEAPNCKHQIPNRKRVKDTDEIDLFLKVGRKALKKAIVQARSGNCLGQISQTIQKVVEGAGYRCARTLTGHGAGEKLHEPPSIPCFLQRGIEETPILKEGMCLAIEVIYCLGKPGLIVDPKDKWTIRTKDGKMSAVFEETIGITEKGTLRLTKLPF